MACDFLEADVNEVLILHNNASSLKVVDFPVFHFTSSDFLGKFEIFSFQLDEFFFKSMQALKGAERFPNENAVEIPKEERACCD